MPETNSGSELAALLAARRARLGSSVGNSFEGGAGDLLKRSSLDDLRPALHALRPSLVAVAEQAAAPVEAPIIKAQGVGVRHASISSIKTSLVYSL